jgi:hypothetical protein
VISQPEVFEVLAVMIVKTTSFWDVTPRYQHLGGTGGTYYVHLQGRKKFHYSPGGTEETHGKSVVRIRNM